MTDLELLDKYCDNCLCFINPLLFNDVRSRGLLSVVNYLPKDPVEAKAVVRARIANWGKYVGDPEMEQIADKVKRLEFLAETLARMNQADVHKTLPIIAQMQEHATFLQDYYKPLKF